MNFLKLTLVLLISLLLNCTAVYDDTPVEDDKTGSNEALSLESVDYIIHVGANTEWEGTLHGPFHNTYYSDDKYMKIEIAVKEHYLPLCFTVRKLTSEGSVSVGYRKKGDTTRYFTSNTIKTEEPYGEVTNCITQIQ